MVDLLLAHSNHPFHNRKQAQKMRPYPLLQTLLAAALLRENGISIAPSDVTLDPPEEKLEALLDSCAPRMLVVREDDFKFLTKMCPGRNRELPFRTAQMARRCNPSTIHSSDSSAHVPDYLGAGFDYVKQCRPDQYFTAVSYPIKGTPYLDRAAPRLVCLAGWDQSTDRDFRVSGRHSSTFYRDADELLRSEMASDPDPVRIHATREALYQTRDEVEA
jgi:hypothetical protein